MADRLALAIFDDVLRPPRKTKEDAGLYLTNPMRWLWGGLAMFGYFAFLTVAAVVGIDLFSSTLRTIGFFFLFFVVSTVFVLFTEDSVTVRSWQGRPIVLREQRIRRRSRLWLDELASVERERVGQRQMLRLTDVRGATLTIPLAKWPGEQRLLQEIADAAAAAGASGEVGNPTHVPESRWVHTAWHVLLFGGLSMWISVLILLDSFR